MQQLTSMQDLKAAISENDKMVVTKNSNDNVIIMSMEEYMKQMMENDIEEHLLKAEDDIRNGRVRDAREVFKEWKEKYGI